MVVYFSQNVSRLTHSKRGCYDTTFSEITTKNQYEVLSCDLSHQYSVTQGKWTFEFIQGKELSKDGRDPRDKISRASQCRAGMWTTQSRADWEDTTKLEMTKRQRKTSGNSELLWTRCKGREEGSGKAGESSYLLYAYSDMGNIITVSQWRK